MIGPHLGAIIGAWLYKITMTQPEQQDRHTDGYKLTSIYAEDHNQQDDCQQKKAQTHLETTRPVIHAKDEDVSRDNANY